MFGFPKSNWTLCYMFCVIYIYEEQIVCIDIQYVGYDFYGQKSY